MPDDKIKPIKRHQALILLSRDHHFGLLLNWKIRKAEELKIEADRVAKYIHYVFENELEYHFREEEELLFGKMDVSDPMRIRAEGEHALIRELIRSLKEKVSFDTIRRFGETLDNHIRFEERELFGYIEKTFSDESLNLIGIQLGERTHPQMTLWPDPFWQKTGN